MSSDDLNLSDLGRNPASVTLKDADFVEIADEIGRRYQGCVLIALQVGDDEERVSWSHRGGKCQAIGMAEQFIFRQNQQLATEDDES